MSMLLCSQSKAPEVLQVCWALVRNYYTVHCTDGMLTIYFFKGDYDGDMVICIWDSSIVEQFSNADPKFMDPPMCLEDHFDIKNETVTEFLQRVPPNSSVDTQIHELQEVLMTPLSDVHSVGIYSTIHENAMYALGYSHPTTISLAWM